MTGKTENLEPNSVAEADDEAAKVLSPAAQRALAEAQARRNQAKADAASLPKEEGGRGGHDPARYGDWEINGRAIDF
ncbi:DUF1674 domain-containing protein [Pararhizobium sp. IMCC21322]|uniref:DUF1674 domain-containing protein n=1 Tax=Pararhizobium sp. IMCC21322 TaxID=3067903 RepID=UPI0027408258|nr:DUF1674 domain-containing protein [Pararhizobium sp. IMCC21322]